MPVTSDWQLLYVGIIKYSEQQQLRKHELRAIVLPVVWSEQLKHSLWWSLSWVQMKKIQLDNENWKAKYGGYR